MLSDLDVMERHARALFTHDELGRLRLVNDPGGAEASRFFLGRTADGNICRFRFDLPGDLATQLEAAGLQEPGAGAEAVPAHFEEYIRLLKTHSPVRKVWMGPAYLFPEKVTRPSREAVVVTAENTDVLSGGFENWIANVPYSGPFLAVLREGRAVSICCSVRITDDTHEAGVETLLAYRGRGYAADVIAKWANEVQELGCMPLYSTSWENRASQRVARQLGLRQYGIDFHVR